MCVFTAHEVTLEVLYCAVLYCTVLCVQVPLEVFGLMQQIYNRALHSLGPDVGCYAPPKLYENELKESLQVK